MTVLPVAPGFCTLGTIFTKWQDEKRPARKTVYSWKKILGKLVAHLQGVEKVGEDQLLLWNTASLSEENYCQRRREDGSAGRSENASRGIQSAPCPTPHSNLIDELRSCPDRQRSFTSDAGVACSV